MSRSRGAMRIRGDKDEVLDLLARLRLTNPFSNIQIVLDTLVINELEDGRVLVGFDFEEWRWYAHIPDIACFVNFWEWCQAYVEEERPDSSLEGKFLRIGEEYHDVEEHEFGDMPYDLISFCRVCEAYELKPDNDLRSILESSQTNKENASGDHIMEPLEADGLREVQVPVLAEARSEDPGAGTPTEAGAD